MSIPPFVIGVTGNIACGKSLVLATLAGLGAETIDADAVYHRLITPGAPLWDALRDRFGETIIAPDGAIDRRALGWIVFADPDALAALDALTHPAVVAAVRAEIAASSSPVVAVDAVKLIESGLDRACDTVWIVACDPARSIERLVRRNALSREDAAARVAAQPDLGPKLARAAIVIDNNGTREHTQAQVVRAWRDTIPLDTTKRIV